MKHDNEEIKMSEVKKEGNIKLERELYFLDGMVNLLLRQMKDIKSEAENLLDYSKEDLNFYIDKIREIDKKIFQVRDIIDGK